MKDYKYLTFTEMQPKAKVFAVKNKSAGDILGYVKWYGPWRKYCFFIDTPGALLVFCAHCLADIQDFINTLMEERRGEK